MGIISMLKGQAIDVIEWTEESSTTMVYRYNGKNNNEIKMGSQLTVRESQVAIMVNEGQLADVFAPGRYELSTQNMPIMTKLRSWKFGFNSPFKAEVYFINTHQFLNMKWGTANPVMMRDPEFGVVRVRAFGTYSFKVKDPVTFLREVFGTSSYMTVDGVSNAIKSKLVSGLSDAIAQSKIPALDLAANYDELGAYAIQTVSPTVEALGLQLCNLVIENISLPEEVEKAMDRRSSMGVLGNLDQYAKYQAAEALRESANNQNGAAGMGTGMAAAAMMGQMMNGMFQNTAPQQPVQQPMQQAAPAAAPAGETKFCSECGNRIARSAKFCPECGARLG